MTSRVHTEGYYYYWYRLKTYKNKLFLKLFMLDILLILNGIAFHTALTQLKQNKSACLSYLLLIIKLMFTCHAIVIRPTIIFMHIYN